MTGMPLRRDSWRRGLIASATGEAESNDQAHPGSAYSFCMSITSRTGFFPHPVRPFANLSNTFACSRQLSLLAATRLLLLLRPPAPHHDVGPRGSDRDGRHRPDCDNHRI